jgi:hypothetical protein
VSRTSSDKKPRASRRGERGRRGKRCQLCWIAMLPAQPIGFVFIRCRACGAYLSLGTATITPDVAIEIRAAEIAACGPRRAPMVREMSWDELESWCEHEDGVSRGDIHVTGWLARDIATHGATS